jgi:hypothetical protein
LIRRSGQAAERLAAPDFSLFYNFMLSFLLSYFAAFTDQMRVSTANKRQNLRVGLVMAVPL